MGFLDGLQIHARLISLVCAGCNFFNIVILISVSGTQCASKEAGDPHDGAVCEYGVVIWQGEIREENSKRLLAHRTCDRYSDHLDFRGDRSSKLASIAHRCERVVGRRFGPGDKHVRPHVLFDLP